MQLQLQVCHKQTAEHSAECIAVIQTAEKLLPVLSNRLRGMFMWKNRASATCLVKFDGFWFGFFYLLGLAEVKFNKLMNTSEWPSLCLTPTSDSRIQIQKYGKNPREGESKWKRSVLLQNVAACSSCPSAWLTPFGCFRHRLVTFNPDKYVALMLLWSPNLSEGDTFWD